MSASRRPVGASAEHKPLTGIRGVAALWVVGSHFALDFPQLMPHGLNGALACGYLGVDVFFVLSGFILACVYPSLPPAQWPGFFAKRIARVYPLNIVLTALVAMLAAFGLPAGVWVDWPSLPWLFLMAGPFLPQPVYAWILTSWSVGVELVCYLGFPFLVAALRRLSRGWLVAAVLAAAAAEFFVQTHYLAYFWSYRAVLRGAGGFCLGAATGMLAQRLPPFPRHLASAVELLGIGGVAIGTAGGLGAAKCYVPGAGLLPLIPLGSALLFLALWSENGLAARLLGGRGVFHLGRISFSIYLIHGPLLGRSGALVYRLEQVMPGGWALTLFALAFLPVMLVLSDLSWRFIEMPGRLVARAWLRRLRRPGRRMALAGSALADDSRPPV